MKRLWILSTASLLAALFFVSCHRDNIKPKPNEQCWVKQVTDADGDLYATYTYDGNNRITKVDYGADYYITLAYAGDKVLVTYYTQSVPELVTLTLNDKGYAVEEEHQNGSIAYFEYDNAGYLKEIDYWDAEDDEKSYVRYFGVVNGNYTTTWYEYDLGGVTTQAISYTSDTNTDDLFRYEMDSFLHRNFPFYGKASKNLVAVDEKVTKDGTEITIGFTYTLSEDDYVTQRHTLLIYNGADTEITENYSYTCQ
ncbi:MAG: hypothetical protein KDC44_13420 [Phaeodactylibacter sp.]|nr:hypothetical protein [Phaeodactylibacter sp.]